MRAASTGVLARTGAVRSGSVHEPAESGAAIKGGQSIRPGTPIQVLPRRSRLADRYEGSRSSQVGYNPFGRAILDRGKSRFCWSVVLTALAVGAALAVSAAMTAGIPTSRRGLAGCNQTASATACSRFCLVRAGSSRQSLHGDSHGGKPDECTSGNVLSDPHDERSQMLAAPGLKDPCLRDLCLKDSVGGICCGSVRTSQTKVKVNP